MTKKDNGSGFVRITGGKFRGRKIQTPGGKTHPMGERERLALFNMISDRINNVWALDLYAGGGTLGLEAMSRGAAYVMMVEKDYSAVLIADKNMVDLGILTTEGRVANTSVDKLIKELEDNEIPSPYGLVFADPPYDKYSDDEASHLGKMVAAGGTLVLSHPSNCNPPEIDDLILEKSKKYAGAAISVYKKPGKLVDFEAISAMQAK